MRLESSTCRKCKLEATACRKYTFSLRAFCAGGNGTELHFACACAYHKDVFDNNDLYSRLEPWRQRRQESGGRSMTGAIRFYTDPNKTERPSQAIDNLLASVVPSAQP